MHVATGGGAVPGGVRVRILRAGDRPAVAWKNGGGVTREIAAWPEGSGMDDFAWRVSLAEVAADGPFSAFPGVDRTLTLAEGAGMELTVAGARRVVGERFAPQDFPGDAPTGCRLLGGPVVNFNVMYRRGVAPAETAVVRGSLALTAAPDEVLLVVALEGPAHAEAEGVSAVLDRFDAALVGVSATGEPFRGVLRSPGHTAVVRLSGRRV
ncbi:HutD family protein [Streptomyces sp. BR123]|uniref:HutD/Ves family protein n=1 Tax=Streptomyces sp. BR123 TaxID=2749828 RepID=UPI0015C4AA69|nr:HutD family protein [Streptomyces sp. BR123]NXY95792.1 HutD family protein [Streptomyces sp. BR123]